MGSKSKPKIVEDKKVVLPPSPKTREVGIVEGLQKMNKGSGTMLMSGDAVVDVLKRSTGILSLDIVIGGGYPYGKIIELFGPNGAGKTTLTLHAIEAVQRAGGVGMFIDAEHALVPKYAEALGVDLSKLILDQPSCGEEALELIESASSLMKPGDLIVVDSVAALTPKAEIDGNMGDSHMGLHARLMGQAMRKLAGVLSKSGVIVIFINQTREKIGIVFGSPETTTGGNALKFYASMRIDTRAIGKVKKGDGIIGNALRLKCIKNKFYPPFREAETTLRFGEGIPRAIDVLTVGKLVGVVEASGAWLSYEGERLGQGINNAAENISITKINKLEQEILDCYKIKRN